MGGRGKGSAGGAGAGGVKGAPKIEAPGKKINIQDLIKHLGFRNLEDARKHARVKEMMKKDDPQGKLVRYLNSHSGGRHGSSIGPVMLHIGMPRSRFNDVIHILKPLHDHGILSMFLPNGQEFHPTAHEWANPAETLATWESIKVRKNFNSASLNRLTSLSPDVLATLAGQRKSGE